MVTIDKLNSFGADTTEGIARCCGSEALYIRLIKMIPNEKNFDNLEKALNENDLDKAFEAAHALKGVTGNLSLTPMFEKCCEMTELLRSRTQMDYEPMLAELLGMRDRITDMLED